VLYKDGVLDPNCKNFRYETQIIHVVGKHLAMETLLLLMEQQVNSSLFRSPVYEIFLRKKTGCRKEKFMTM